MSDHTTDCSGPPPPKRQANAVFIQQDGLRLEIPGTYLERESLVSNAIENTRDARFLVIRSPPATGKTSLLQLINRKIKKEDENNQVFYLRTSTFDNLFDFVKSKTGVDFGNETVEYRAGKTGTEIWILMDDAHRFYEQAHFEFWETVVKERNTSAVWKEHEVFFVVAATYYLTTAESPVSFYNQKRLGPGDLKLSEQECDDLFRLYFGFEEWEQYREKLKFLSNGHVGVFCQGLSLLSDLFMTTDHRSRTCPVTEEKALYGLCETSRFTDKLEGCFSRTACSKEDHEIILNVVLDAYHQEAESDDQISYLEPISRLQRTGVLTVGCEFSCPAAASFYYNVLFPRRAPGSSAPESIDVLIINAVRRISALQLRGACDTDENGKKVFPKEAVYQQLFHEAITAQLPIRHYVLPEKNTKAMIRGRVVTGELDFYINGSLKWALELLREGNGIGEHFGRISGKYRNVDANEWLVVDCKKGLARPLLTNENRCTIAFADDFEVCHCYMREQIDPLEIRLTP